MAAPVAKKTDRGSNKVKGKPQRFINGHQLLKPGPAYRVEDRGYETPCWIWQKTTQVGGYGTISRKGVPVYAHRIYYERSHGPIPDGHEIHHICCQRACVNPEHLQALTALEHNRIEPRGFARRPYRG